MYLSLDPVKVFDSYKFNDTVVVDVDSKVLNQVLKQDYYRVEGSVVRLVAREEEELTVDYYQRDPLVSRNIQSL